MGRRAVFGTGHAICRITPAANLIGGLVKDTDENETKFYR